MKRMKAKIMVSILLAAMMTSEAMGAIVPVSPGPGHVPAAYKNGIVPYWNDTAMVSVTLSVDGNELTPIAIIQTYSSTTKTSGTMYLEKNVSGKWKTVKAWSVSGTGIFTVKKTYTGTPGTEYRTRVVLKIGSDSIDEASSGYEL